MKSSLSAIILALSLCMPAFAATAPTPVAPVKVICNTSAGSLTIMVEPSWAPRGAARFLQMVNDGFYKDVPLFRCVNKFLCQFGVTPPRKDAKTYSAITDDAKLPTLRDFKRGYLSFAGNAVNSRTNHVFITLGEKVESLGTMPWETPFGYVVPNSLSTVDHFYTGYGDIKPWGLGPDPAKIEAADGAAYLKREYPKLDYINSCSRAAVK